MRRAVTFLAVLCAFVAAGVGCVPSPELARDISQPQPENMPEKTSFVTSDGVTVVGEHYVGDGDGPSALLLHMMPATKESWREFAPVLLDAGFSRVLAIDLRGHGESVVGSDGERLDYKLFDDGDHQAKTLDVDAAVAWLEGQGATKDRLAVVGASIGANLSVVYGAEHPEVRAVAALSPGLDYRGVTTPDKVSRYAEGQGLFLAASEEDELSFETNRELKRLMPDAVLKEFRGAGHGTTMFEHEPELMGELAEWLAGRF